MHKSIKHDRPIRRVWGLCLPWVLLPSEVAQGTRQGSAETWRSSTPFLWGLAPEISLDFIFPLLSSRIYTPDVARGQPEESCCFSLPCKARRHALKPLFHPSPVTCSLSPPPPFPNF